MLYFVNSQCFVIVPPQKPKIIDERGKEVQSRAGPYEEGGDMTLTCFVTGGKCFLKCLSQHILDAPALVKLSHP